MVRALTNDRPPSIPHRGTLKRWTPQLSVEVPVLSFSQVAFRIFDQPNERVLVQDLTSATATGSRKQPFMVAAVTILVLAAAVVGIGQGDLSGQASPQEVAERYLAARDAYDANAARPLIAPDAQLADMPVIGVDELDAGFEMLSIYEMSYDPFECSEAEGGPEVWVVCTYQLNSAANGPVGYPPIGGKIRFRIVEGKIAELRNQAPVGLYSPFVFRPFIDWLVAEHGEEAVERLYRILPSGIATPRLDPEALDYARTIVAEYTGS